MLDNVVAAAKLRRNFGDALDHFCIETSVHLFPGTIQRLVTAVSPAYVYQVRFWNNGQRLRAIGCARSL